ncbi:MAG: hypothetical protein ACFFDW_13470 [Candidatus Thorarchaeota archaeon]
MLKKRNLIKSLLEEYWGEDCEVCGSTSSPLIEYSISESLVSVEMKCSQCGLTVSYNKHKQNASYNVRDSKSNQLELRPKILSAFF